MTDTGWTPARVATLRRMWSEGATYNEISAVLGITRNCVAGKRKRMKLPPNGGARSLPLTPAERAERERVVREVIEAGGASREAARKLGCGIDAVFKVAKRLDLQWPQNQAIRGQGRPRTGVNAWRAQTPRPPRTAVQRPEIVPDTAITLRDIKTHQCHYPIGEPKGLDTVYCGAVRLTGSSYCQLHHAVVWTPPPLSTNTSKAWRAA